MNLKEIGILLIGLFLGSSLLIAYKYYVAKGKVFQISRVLVFKYILRFILLISFLLLCFYAINLKQNKDSIGQKVGSTLFVISDNSSSLTWNSLKDKVNELPENASYSLVIYEQKALLFLQVIPNTNRESFLNLIERANESSSMHPKRRFTDRLTTYPTVDQFEVFILNKHQWQSITNDTSNDSLFSTSSLNSWMGNSYLLVYLVILILVLLFIDIVFTAKAIKI
jgi:hypothetical protein